MDWKDIGGQLIRAGAPIIGGAIGGPIGGMIGGGLGNILANALGVEETPEAVDKAIRETPPDVLTAKLSAAEAEAQAKWPALAEMVKAQEEGRTERFKSGVADNADARDANERLIQTKSPIAWAPVIVTAMVVVGFFIVLYHLLNRPPKIDDNFKDVLLLLLGTLTTAFIQSVQYWLGSSAGSAAKDAAMRDITATSVVAAANSTPVLPPPKGPAKR